MAVVQVLVAGKDIKATQFKVGLGGEKAQLIAIGFTKSNELFVGRMAMVGIASSLIGEVSCLPRSMECT